MPEPRAAGQAPRVRVAVADDDALIRRTVAAIIEQEDGLELAGVAEHTRAAIEVARDADVLIADIRMPGGGAMTAAEELRASGCATAVVALSGHHGAREDRERLAQAGVVASLVKGCGIEEIVEAVRTAATAAAQARSDGSRRSATTRSTASRDSGDRLAFARIA